MNVGWQRSCDHLLFGEAAEFMAKGRDFETTEMIRRKLELADEMLDALRQWQWAEKNNDPQELDNARTSRDLAITKATQEKTE